LAWREYCGSQQYHKRGIFGNGTNGVGDIQENSALKKAYEMGKAVE